MPRGNPVVRHLPANKTSGSGTHHTNLTFASHMHGKKYNEILHIIARHYCCMCPFARLLCNLSRWVGQSCIMLASPRPDLASSIYTCILFQKERRQSIQSFLQIRPERSYFRNSMSPRGHGMINAELILHQRLGHVITFER